MHGTITFDTTWYTAWRFSATLHEIANADILADLPEMGEGGGQQAQMLKDTQCSKERADSGTKHG